MGGAVTGSNLGETDRALQGGCTAGCVGDPINPATGNKYQVEKDYVGNTVMPLRFIRYYNSDNRVVSTSMGAHWRHSYDRSILATAYGSEVVAIAYRPDGHSYSYDSTDGITWTAVGNTIDTLQRTYNGSGTPTGWIYKTRKDELETYDASGRLIQITDHAGRITTLAYDALSRLVTVTEPYARALTFFYDSAGYLLSVTDPAGGAYVYQHDANGNLTGVQYADGTNRTYLYNEAALTSGANLPNALTGIVDGSSQRYMTVGYNAQGKAISIQLGTSTDLFTIQYSGSSTSPQVTDPIGTVRTYNFGVANSAYKISSVSSGGSDAACAHCASSQSVLYDSNGFISQRTDFNGNVTRYSFDLRGLELSRTEGYGSAVARTITTQWDSVFHLPKQIDEPGRRTVYTYDLSGNKTNESVTDTNTSATRSTSYTYNGQNLLSTVDGPRTDVTDVTTYAYDSSGNLSTITNVLGHQIRIALYDLQGNPTRMFDGNNVQTDITYDARQRVKTVSTAGATTSYSYNINGDIAKAILPNGSQLTYGYDDAYKLTDITDNLGNHIHYTLDGLGNRLSESIYDGGDVLRKSLSRVVGIDGRIKEIHGANGQTTAYTYDGYGNIKSLKEAGLYLTQYNYDALNRLSAVTDAKSGYTTYGYDALDHTLSVKDPSNLTTIYAVDALNSTLSVNSPDSGLTTNTYDAAGNISSSTDARGITTQYTYDALNRIKKKAYPTSAENVFYFYDGSNYSPAYPYGIGRLTGISDPSGQSTYAYAARGTLFAESNVVASHNYATFYAYDSADNLTQMAYSTGDLLTYTRNAIGQVTQVNATLSGHAQTLASNIQYMPFGPWKQMTMGSGVTTSRSYDQDYRLSSLTAAGVLGRSYGYDARNNATSISDAIAPSKSQTLTYDELNRLTTATGTYGNLSYTYVDSTGDRKTGGLTSNPATYTYATTSHRLNTVSAPNAHAYTYDATGNVVADGATTYTFSNANRLLTVSGSASPFYFYDAFGQRTVKVTASATTVYLRDKDRNITVENNLSGVAGAEYFYLNGEPLALYYPSTTAAATAGTYFYANDHLATPQALTNASGAVSWSADYQPFGAVVVTTASITNNLRFPGQYLDAETGFHQNGFRDYEPSLGRYLESDPIGLQGGINTYAYVEGNPISFDDPYGLWAFGDALPQGVVDYSAGFGDGISLGATELIRSAAGIDGSVDHCSGAYLGGVLSGLALTGKGYVVGAELRIGRNFRLAPWGNRTGHKYGELPHYHRRVLDANGNTIPGGGIGRHRPYEGW
ncbi:RHS repeat-associated core domain-containing protein [Stenotrophobium rhamnosiphilum]|uniref:RHS repeat-associated core domain-containing protein n=1 Tax=Stenotrophobium rhamnosiphilum TaxID=2029166 RepID=UPI001374B1A5|nr:RHS repeat-associated core domain-containing protein [Stenotrophobium rhamnosiphilum]